MLLPGGSITIQILRLQALKYFSSLRSHRFQAPCFPKFWQLECLFLINAINNFLTKKECNTNTIEETDRFEIGIWYERFFFQRYFPWQEARPLYFHPIRNSSILYIITKTNKFNTKESKKGGMLLFVSFVVLLVDTSDNCEMVGIRLKS